MINVHLDYLSVETVGHSIDGIQNLLNTTLEPTEKRIPRKAKEFPEVYKTKNNGLVGFGVDNCHITLAGKDLQLCDQYNLVKRSGIVKAHRVDVAIDDTERTLIKACPVPGSGKLDPKTGKIDLKTIEYYPNLIDYLWEGAYYPLVGLTQIRQKNHLDSTYYVGSRQSPRMIRLYYKSELKAYRYEAELKKAEAETCRRICEIAKNEEDLFSRLAGQSLYLSLYPLDSDYRITPNRNRIERVQWFEDWKKSITSAPRSKPDYSGLTTDLQKFAKHIESMSGSMYTLRASLSQEDWDNWMNNLLYEGTKKAKNRVPVPMKYNIATNSFEWR